MNTPRQKLFRRLCIGLLVVLALLGGVVAYFAYAPRAPLPPGPIVEETLDIGGIQRHYQAFVPANLKDGASVLFVYHPSQSNSEEIRRIVGGVLERIAEQENIIVVYPDGYEGHFNDCRIEAAYSARKLNVDDIGFTKRIINKFVAEKKIEPKHVFALGFSNGGQMALRLALETPDMIRGVAAIGANLPTSDNMDCRVAATPSRCVVLVAGTRDRISPYRGGLVTLFGFGSRGHVLSSQGSAEWFANALGLASAGTQPLETVNGISAEQQDWKSPKGHVRLVTIKGGGHTVPQGGYGYAPMFGATYRSDSILESTWQLFAASRN
jgi:polyhydroxybutyrate depolymerase